MQDSIKALGLSIVVTVMGVVVVQNFYKLNKIQLAVVVVVLVGVAFLLIYRPPSLPKPVLGWRRQRSEHLITSNFTTVTTVEFPSMAPKGTATFYVENDGASDLTNATLYIMYDLDVEVTSDRPFHVLPHQEFANRNLTIDIPLIRKAPSEPFVFDLVVTRLGPMTKLQFKIEADHIPSTKLGQVIVMHSKPSS